jgi:hypothetical protein
MDYMTFRASRSRAARLGAVIAVGVVSAPGKKTVLAQRTGAAGAAVTCSATR